MISRIIAALSSLGAIVSVLIVDPGQFVFPYMGLMAGIASLIAVVGAESPLLMIILPLTFIAVMIVYGSLEFGALILLAVRSFMAKPSASFRKITHWGALLLAMTLICGLTLLRVFPGTQDPPIQVSPAYFVYPVLLVIFALILLMTDKTRAEQGGPPNTHPRHASCLPLRGGTSRAASSHL